MQFILVIWHAMACANFLSSVYVPGLSCAAGRRHVHAKCPLKRLVFWLTAACHMAALAEAHARMLQLQAVAKNVHDCREGNRMDLCDETDAIAGDNTCLADQRNRRPHGLY